MTEWDVVEALKIIKKACNSYSCEFCPLSGSKGQCLVTYRTPDGWSIIEPEEPRKLLAEDVNI